jgi:hypothetical protein
VGARLGLGNIRPKKGGEKEKGRDGINGMPPRP